MASPAPTAPPHRSRLHWSLWTVLALTVLLVGAMVATALWLWRTDSGFATVARLLPRLSGNLIVVDAPQGSFAHGFRVGLLRVNAGTTQVEVRELQAKLANADFALHLGGLRFDFETLMADRVLLRLRPSAQPAGPPPQSIGSPVPVTAQRLAIGELVIATGADPSPTEFVVRNIDAQARIGPEGYAIDAGRLALGPLASPLQLTLDGSLGARTPFPVDLTGTLATTLQSKDLQATWRAGGSLLDLALDAAVDAAGTQGTVAARLNVFEAPTLRALRADVRDLDPTAWVSGAPTARLSVQADLVPQPGAVFALRGPVTVTNALPGPVDSQRIPVRTARAQIELTRERLLARDVVAELSRGTVRGQYDLNLADVQRWRAQLQFAGVDPLALHSKLRTMLLDGQGTVQHDAGTTTVVGRLANRGAPVASLDVDLAVTPRQLRVRTAALRLGEGVASFTGELGLDGARRTALSGTVAQLDPSLLVPGMQARINGNFGLDGSLSPQPAGRLDFMLTESQAYGQPLAGTGYVVLATDQSLDVDLQLVVRSASLTAKGGLGRAGQSLRANLVVPQLKDLGLPAAGSVRASLRAAGDWRAPAGELQFEASQLRYGENSVDEANGIASYAGGLDGEFAVQLNGSSHRFRRNPMLSLKTVSLQASGRPSSHRIELAGSNEEAQQLLARIAGGWDRKAAQWKGSVDTLRAGAPINLALQGAAPVVTDFKVVKVGPAAFNMFGATFEAVQLDTTGGVLNTSGRFADLQLAELDPSGERLIKNAAARERVPLTLRGEWQLRAGTAVDGRIVVERSGGDIHSGFGRNAAMGITDLRALVEIRASRLQATARMEGTRAGVLEATAQADVDASSGLRLAQQRPWLIKAQADLPSIAWVNAFLPEPLRGDLRLGGSVKGALVVEGTPAKPVANGSFTGKDLRVAWVEQALRLRNGTLAARVDGTEIVLDELRFEGPPLVAPADARVRTAGGTDSGTLVVNGKLQLRTLSGVLQLAAQRMPVLQRADRWVRVDGGANIVFDERRVQLNGAVAANAGFIDFSRPNLPTLSNDVQVIRSVDQARAPRDAPTGFAFDLGIDLGPAFYIRGLGLDTRIDGAVRLRSEGRGIRATGVVEARDGVFEGFGQKLVIERGRVNFQGPVENPGLDVLALRPGLPVEVGVSITRTAQNPLIRLHSDEGLPDFQILSWLVLGRAAEDSGADRLALASAAVGLLSGTGEGVPSQLAKRLGIDEFGLRSGEMAGAGSLLPRTAVAGNIRGSNTATAASEFITIGKRLNDQIRITFEQGLGGAESLVQVSYQLSRRLSVIGRAGTENALDLVYSLTFD
jgi:translocation and assembly module TamB